MCFAYNSRALDRVRGWLGFAVFSAPHYILTFSHTVYAFKLSQSESEGPDAESLGSENSASNSDRSLLTYTTTLAMHALS